MPQKNFAEWGRGGASGGPAAAGGAGKRFWPLSRQRYPKQLLKIEGDRGMLQAAVERIAPLVPRENVAWPHPSPACPRPRTRPLQAAAPS